MLRKIMVAEIKKNERFVYGYKCESCNDVFSHDEAGEHQISPAQFDSNGGSPAEYEDCCPICGSTSLKSGWLDAEILEWFANTTFEKLCDIVLLVVPFGYWGWMRVAFNLNNDKADWEWCQQTWYAILENTEHFELPLHIKSRVELHKKHIEELVKK